MDPFSASLLNRGESSTITKLLVQQLRTYAQHVFVRFVQMTLWILGNPRQKMPEEILEPCKCDTFYRICKTGGSFPAFSAWG